MFKRNKGVRLVKERQQQSFSIFPHKPERIMLIIVTEIYIKFTQIAV